MFVRKERADNAEQHADNGDSNPCFEGDRMTDGTPGTASEEQQPDNETEQELRDVIGRCTN